MRGSVDADVAATVHEWLFEQDLDAAVWTGLGEGNRWADHGYEGFTVENALDYLRHLDEHHLQAAGDYIAFAPVEVDTPVRRGSGF